MKLFPLFVGWCALLLLCWSAVLAVSFLSWGATGLFRGHKSLLESTEGDALPVLEKNAKHDQIIS